MNLKYMPYSMLGSLLLLEILSLTTADSVWPWAILSHQTLGLRILGWYLVAQLGLVTLAYMVMRAMPDKPCPICYKDLKAYIPVYGAPAMCSRCRTIFHKNCFKSKSRCPVCFPEAEEETGIGLDFTKDLPSD